MNAASKNAKKALKLLRQTHFLYASELPHNFFERWQKNKFFKKERHVRLFNIMANYRTNGGKRNSRIH